MSPEPRLDRRDRGTVLPLVLFFVLVLGLVLASTARYTATNLRYSTVVEQRASASAAAEAAVRYAIQRVASNSVTSCENGPVTIARTYDVATDPVLADADTIEITCDRLDSEPTSLSEWAAVVTGEGVTGTTCEISVTTDCRFLVNELPTAPDHATSGRIFVPSLRQNEFRVNIEAVEFDGNLFYDGSSDDCAAIDRYNGPGSFDDDIVLTSGQFVCWPQTWQQVVAEPPVPSPLPTATPPPAGTDVNGCRVFEPGRYTSLNLDVGEHNYFKSGIYVFDNFTIDTGGSNTFILGGYPPDERFDNRLITTGPCMAVQAADGLSPGPSPAGVSEHGVTWYFTGSTGLTLTGHTSIELLPKLHSEGSREHAVSIHVIGNNGGDAISASTSLDHNHVAVHGQIWAPYRQVDLQDTIAEVTDTGPFTSGVVAAQLFVDASTYPAAALGPDRTQSDHDLLLTAAATVDGVRVEARAVVTHRPRADPGDRVAVNSIRITD